MATNSRESFVRLAENRTRKVIKNIRLIGNLSNTSNYSYSEDDVAKIFTVLETELRAARKRFREADGSSKEINFSL